MSLEYIISSRNSDQHVLAVATERLCDSTVLNTSGGNLYQRGGPPASVSALKLFKAFRWHWDLH
jgi:hypothetical protein